MRDAQLVGTRRNPGLVLTFKGHDPLPRAVKLTRVRRPGLAPVTGPPTLLDWVRRLPGRSWDPDRTAWVVTAVGPDPDRVLADAGFTVDLARSAKAGVRSLSQLVQPWVELATEVPASLGVGGDLDETHTVIWPRMAGYEGCVKMVPAAARWLKDPGCWVAQTADMAAVTGLAVPAHVRALAARLHAARTAGGADAAVASRSARLAKAAHIDDVRATANQLISQLGDVPDWFGFDLFGYQSAGSIAVAAGHSLLCDAPGLGKTAQALAAAAIRGCQRVVVICPPVVNTNWARETDRSHLVEHMGTAVLVPGPGPQLLTSTSPAAPPQSPRSLPSLDPKAVIGAPGGLIVRIVSGRKEPELPAAGVVIVSDSLLAARPALLARVCAWAPDAVLVDEVHRAKTFESARATASRTVAAAVGAGLRVPMTGTPIFSSPADLAAALAISGHLDTVFGGLSQFLNTYCERNFFNAWVADAAMMPQLRAILEAQVWVRRTKAQVLPDLPAKLRTGVFVDVDLSGFRVAHAEVETKVDQWLEDFEAKHARLPSAPPPGQPAGSGASEVETWARGQVGLISPLRRAAGMAKVEAAVERIREHVEATTTTGGDGRPVYDRPLVVWVHHREVGDAMAVAVPAAVARTEIIRGGTTADERGRIVDDFQAGKIPVLVASISAAGVGITLTRSCDALFVETDWTVANITQAEDRCLRIGQTRPVSLTTLIAAGTLDERIQGVLQTKSALLDVLLEGGDNSPAVVGVDADAGTTPAGIITDMAVALIAARGRRRRKRAA